MRDACERVFTVRAQQTWPPELSVQPSWIDAYAALAGELGIDDDVEHAAGAVRAFIDRIARA